MNQVFAIIVAKLRMARHEVAGVREQSRLKVGVISLSALLLWVGTFFFFHEGFDWVVQFGGLAGAEFNFGELLMSRLLSVLSLSVFLLLIFSNVLVAFATLYRSHEVVYLLQGPIRHDQFFYARFFECVAFSSWSLAFLGSPLFLAYGLSMKVSLLFYLATVVFFLPAIIVPACIGAAAAMVLVRVFPRLKPSVMAVIGLITVGALFFYIRSVLRGQRISDDTVLPVFLAATGHTQSFLLPSHWTAEGILAAARFDFGGCLFWFAMLISTAMMALLSCGWLANRIFYPGWSYLEGQDRQRFRPMNRGLLNRAAALLGSIPEPARSLAAKDIKLFWRDPTQWSQFVIFFGIMAVYLANLRNSSNLYEQPMWRSWIASLNVGSVTLILATLTSRFVFPLVSLEGRRFWILGLAPLTFRQVVWQKFWLSLCTTSLFTVGLGVLSGYMLQLEPVYFWLTVYTVSLANFGLAGLAVGLGTLYPTFTEDNPARIVSGLGGTLNLLLSVGYIALMVSTQTLILQWRAVERFTGTEWFWYALAAVLAFDTALTLCCVVVPMRLGVKNLEDMEF